jgi:hypothetical protein
MFRILHGLMMGAGRRRVNGTKPQDTNAHEGGDGEVLEVFEEGGSLVGAVFRDAESAALRFGSRLNFLGWLR